MTGSSVLVYAGKGASHSWAWLADLFESNGFFRVRFVDHQELGAVVKDTPPRLVIVSGGDGFAIGSCLSGTGFARLRDYLSGGGRYIGVCAGAYLPLPSRIEPFNQFNLSSTRIRNISEPCASCEESPPRVSIRYGACAIVHPVRGILEVGQDGHGFTAPLYGGPVFREPTEDVVLLRYLSFTRDTELQADRDTAERTVLDAPAAIRCAVGDGLMILAGPHLEHPEYPTANRVFMEWCGLSPSSNSGARSRPPVRPRKDLLRSIADLKVAVLGMENRSFVVGGKVWDGGRLLELLAAVEKRSWSADDDTARAVSSLLERARDELFSMRPEDIGEAEAAPAHLVEAARICLNRHFSVMNG